MYVVKRPSETRRPGGSVTRPVHPHLGKSGVPLPAVFGRYRGFAKVTDAQREALAEKRDAVLGKSGVPLPAVFGRYLGLAKVTDAQREALAEKRDAVLDSKAPADDPQTPADDPQTPADER